MIWVVTVWMLLMAGMSVETRQFSTHAECEAYRQTVTERRFKPDRPPGSGVLVGGCRPKMVDLPSASPQR